MKVIGIVGYHNSGKTTLAQKIARLLSQKGYKVGYIKHDPKDHGITDKEGSDTFRLSELSVKRALISPSKTTLWIEGSFSLKEILSSFFLDMDFVIVEGFKGEEWLPKIALGDVEAHNVILRIKGDVDPKDIVELLERSEGLKWR